MHSPSGGGGGGGPSGGGGRAAGGDFTTERELLFPLSTFWSLTPLTPPAVVLLLDVTSNAFSRAERCASSAAPEPMLEDLSSLAPKLSNCEYLGRALVLPVPFEPCPAAPGVDWLGRGQERFTPGQQESTHYKTQFAIYCFVVNAKRALASLTKNSEHTC